MGMPWAPLALDICNGTLYGTENNAGIPGKVFALKP